MMASAATRQRKDDPDVAVVDVNHHHYHHNHNQYLAHTTTKKDTTKTRFLLLLRLVILILAAQIFVTHFLGGSVVSTNTRQVVEGDTFVSPRVLSTSTIDGENHEVEFKKQQQHRNEKAQDQKAPTDYTFDNVLYFNSLFHPAGRVFMEEQLESFGIRSPRRIELVSGNQTECGERQTCLERLQLASTYEWMLRFPNFYLGIKAKKLNKKNRKDSKNNNNKDTQSGTTLIWHRDDIQITDMEILKEIVTKTTNSSSSSHPQYPYWKVLQLQCDKQQENIIPGQQLLLPKTKLGSSSSGNFKMVPGKCNRTDGILWRTADDLVFKIQPYLINKDMNLQTAIDLAWSSVLKGKTYCLVAVEGAGGPSYCHINRDSRSNNVQKHEESPSEKLPVVHHIRNFRQKATIQEIQEEVAKGKISNPYGPHPIERIYYSNLEKNVLRRRIMEGWLQPLQERYNSSIRNRDRSNRTTTTTTTNPTYKRIQAIRGDPNNCVSQKNGTIQCVGVSGISRTLVSVIDEEDLLVSSSSNHNIDDGLTMVLEDDYVLTDDTFDRLEESLNLVPNDWDIVRFDCWGGVEKFGFKRINKYVVQTTSRPDVTTNETHIPPCGGAYSMLWRRRRMSDDDNNNQSSSPTSSSIYYKLREMWSKTPYNGVDCAIPLTPSVKSYCVNIGLGDEYKIPSELTDIIKLHEML